ncbi:hypothetical protein ASPZODRAFT_135375 [Penicilliopsis zonata CBS 506.65]|uniref:Protein BFR2 n=1 Tax=Penicilliopsis zonata CBS 506.65 TaxID=1073090 RepID=A0A1L9S9V9_9EURO|nr:hypothetical protein ASPZODRAFT_135375 [Penicilliopsis zonata CBS 506.65]OJJ43963.1 hypothetical protein ASPZODRAFT_135375 [Penicilliopsis zonata CBS 506.65]
MRSSGEEEDEDEEDSDEEDEEDSEEEDAAEVWKKLKALKNKKKQQKGDESDDEESIDEEIGMSDEEEDDEDDEEEDDEDMDSEMSEDEEDDDEDEPSRNKKADKTKTDDRDELRRLMASDQKTIAATISQAAKADAVKGRAVKQQRATFDALLNTRIKLQKGLTAVNDLSLTAKNTDEEVDEEAIKSVESAALALWSTLEELRLALADAHAKDDSKKRKRPQPVSPGASPASLWKRMSDLETDAVSHRRAVLDKWSSKVRGSTASLANSRGKLLAGSSGQQQMLTSVLDAHVATETSERASKRSRGESKNNNNNNGDEEKQEPVYEDSVFYQSLLRDLVEQRMSSSDAMTNGLETLHIQLPSRLASLHPVTGMRNDKVKREVDTRASKGRKMKFNVHEKLQNFMAPEERGSWTNRAREEFFASLLGKTASGLLGEEDGEDASGAEESDEDREEGGLRLFRGD